MFRGSQTPGTLRGSQNFPSSSPTDSRVPMTPNINRHNSSIDQFVPSTPASQERQHHVHTPLIPAITTPTPRPSVSLGTSPINVLTHLQASTLVPCEVQGNGCADQLVPTTPEGFLQVSQNNGDNEQLLARSQSEINLGKVERKESQVQSSTKKICPSRRRLSLEKTCKRLTQTSAPSLSTFKTCKRLTQTSAPSLSTFNHSTTSEDNKYVLVLDQKFLPTMLTRPNSSGGIPSSSHHSPSPGVHPPPGAHPPPWTHPPPGAHSPPEAHQPPGTHPPPGLHPPPEAHPPSGTHPPPGVHPPPPGLHPPPPGLHPPPDTRRSPTHFPSISSHQSNLHPRHVENTATTSHLPSTWDLFHEPRLLGHPSSHRRHEVTHARRQALLGNSSVQSPSSSHVVPCHSTAVIDLFSGDDIFFC